MGGWWVEEVGDALSYAVILQQSFCITAHLGRNSGPESVGQHCSTRNDTKRPHIIWLALMVAGRQLRARNNDLHVRGELLLCEHAYEYQCYPPHYISTPNAVAAFLPATAFAPTNLWFANIFIVNNICVNMHMNYLYIYDN